MPEQSAQGGYDILVNDKISPNVGKKLRDISTQARLAHKNIGILQAGLNALNVGSISRLTTASAKLTNAQARLRNSTAKETIAQAKSTTEKARAALATQKLRTEKQRTTAATHNSAAASARATKSLIQQEIASERLTAAKNGETIAQNRNAAAARNAGDAAGYASRRLSRATSSARQAAQRTQNLIFQVQDVAVGLASGQKPLTVLIQQGTQIVGAFGTGTGVTGILRGVVKAIFAMLAPFKLVLLAVGAAVGAIFAMRHEINKARGSSVSFGDTFKAIFQVAGRAITNFLLPTIRQLTPVFKAVYDGLVVTTKVLINGLIGGFVFWAKVIGGIWTLTGNVMVNAMRASVNAIIDITEGAIQYILSATSFLFKPIVAALDFFGKEHPLDALANPENFSLDKYKLEYVAIGRGISEIFEEAIVAGNIDYAGRFFNAVADQAEENAKKRAEAEAEENKELSSKQKLLIDLTKPLTDYIQLQSDLNELLRDRTITQPIADRALFNTDAARSLRGVESGLGGDIAKQNALAEIQATENDHLLIVQQAVALRIRTETEGAARIAQIRLQTASKIRDAEQQDQKLRLSYAAQTFDALATGLEDYAGKHSDVYRTLFAASKAFAIAEALINLQLAISNASKLPPPANYAAIAEAATLGASIIANIQAVAGLGFRQGGYTGDGPVNAIAGAVHRKEYVFDAASTARIGVQNLERIRRGDAQAPKPYRAGGDVRVGINVNIENHGTDKEFEVKQVNRDEVRIIARDTAKEVVRRDTPDVVAQEIRNPTSRTSRALNQHTKLERQLN